LVHVLAAQDVFSLGVLLQEVRGSQGSQLLALLRYTTGAASKAIRERITSLTHVHPNIEFSRPEAGHLVVVPSSGGLHMSHICLSFTMQVVMHTPLLQRGLPCEAVAPWDAPADVLQLIDDCMQRRPEDRPTAQVHIT